MHDVGETFDIHEFFNRHCPGFRDAAQVIAAQVNEHYMLCALLWVGQQFGFQSQVFLFGFASPAGACNGSDFKLTGRAAHHHFRRGAKQGRAAGLSHRRAVREFHVEHERRRIGLPQTAVDSKWLVRHRHSEPGGKDHLNAFALGNEFLAPFDTGHVLLLAGVDLGRPGLGSGKVDAPFHGCRPGCRAFIEAEVAAGMAQVVEQDQLAGQDQAGLGVGGIADIGQLAFEHSSDTVAEVAIEASGKAGQAVTAVVARGCLVDAEHPDALLDAVQIRHAFKPFQRGEPFVRGFDNELAVHRVEHQAIVPGDETVAPQSTVHLGGLQ